MPLFSPIYTSTRPYSQTRSSTQRDLMLPDEILRLDRKKCIALFQGHKPALLYKLTPEELPDYAALKSCRVIDYIPAWRRQKNNAQPAPVTKPAPPPFQPRQTRPEPEPAPNEPNPAEDLIYSVPELETGILEGLGMVEKPLTAILGDDDLEDDMDSPPHG